LTTLGNFSIKKKSSKITIEEIILQTKLVPHIKKKKKQKKERKQKGEQKKEKKKKR
jgi:hypothetical protein